MKAYLRTRRSLSRPPSYNTVSKPPRYSLCGLTPGSPTSLYSNQDEDGFPDPPSYSQVFTVELRRSVPSTELVPLSTEVYVNINTSPNIIDSSDVINDVNVHQATSSYQSSDIHSDLDSVDNGHINDSNCHTTTKQKISSCKSLFSFDNRSKVLLPGASQKKSFSLQKFRADSVSSSSDSISAPLLDDYADL